METPPITTPLLPSYLLYDNYTTLDWYLYTIADAFPLSRGFLYSLIFSPLLFSFRIISFINFYAPLSSFLSLPFLALTWHSQTSSPDA
jgi:hypothetical protein